MNDHSLKSYCNVLYEFLCFSKELRNIFADVSSFLVISGHFALWRHSTSFEVIRQDAQNQIRNCSSHVCACSDEVWYWLSHFLVIYDFQRTSFLDHIFCWPVVGQPIRYYIWSPIFKLLLLLNHSSVSYKWPRVRKPWCCSLWIFMF